MSKCEVKYIDISAEYNSVYELMLSDSRIQLQEERERVHPRLQILVLYTNEWKSQLMDMAALAV